MSSETKRKEFSILPLLKIYFRSSVKDVDTTIVLIAWSIGKMVQNGVQTVIFTVTINLRCQNKEGRSWRSCYCEKTKKISTRKT